ncbi:hypothetical protein HPC49_28430 [Pyxidicoccus fallax]|uniref:Lipoprotein n=1 Tax=Pyxidicoccus fallax TaxID=394095 RepID=A0A848LNK0_9BACT|nr:hypothetical protein [Pyxidicoccus fallax]NMO19134.1 hypothetical protein [Pyxidicoccus fallax]NPC82132.1 hypothetical protein [Pyxidicoccus fallax]
MGRWRTGTVGLALGICAALGTGCDSEKVNPPAKPGGEVEEPAPLPEAPELPETLPGDARWTAHTATAGRQDATAVATDGEGGIVVLGTSEPAEAQGTSADSHGTTLTVSRHDGGGQQLWSRSFTPEPREGGAADVRSPLLAVSRTGDIFLAGKVEGRLRLGETVITDSSFVAKLDPDGTPRWARAVGPVRALLPDGDGELVLAQGMVVERYDAEGARRWSREVPAMASASVVALDPEGGLVMAGNKHLGPFEIRGFIARLSPDGDVRWEQELAPEGPSFTDVALRPDGSFLFTGDFSGTFQWGRDTLQSPCTQRSCHRTAYALAVDGYGEPLWARTLDSQTKSGSEGARLAVDATGGAAVVWRHGCGSELATLSSGGEVLWQNLYVTTPCSATPLLRDVAFLPDGDVVGAGMFLGTRSFGGKKLTASDSDVFLQRLVP